MSPAETGGLKAAKSIGIPTKTSLGDFVPSIGPKAHDSRAQTSVPMGCRVWKYRKMARQTAAAARCFEVWPLTDFSDGAFEVLLLIAVVTIITGLGLCFFRKLRD